MTATENRRPPRTRTAQTTHRDDTAAMTLLHTARCCNQLAITPYKCSYQRRTVTFSRHPKDGLILRCMLLYSHPLNTATIQTTPLPPTSYYYHHHHHHHHHHHYYYYYYYILLLSDRESRFLFNRSILSRDHSMLIRVPQRSPKVKPLQSRTFRDC